jgi:hypothetical protein
VTGPVLDEDAVIAAVDLVGRSGATGFEFGYLHDDVPTEEAGWWAKAQYRGARISVQDHRGPVEACEALARRILTGAKCAHCGGLVALSDRGAVAYGGQMADGTTFTLEQARAAGRCRWTREGQRWARGCEVPDAAPAAAAGDASRAERRRAARASRKRRPR